MFDLTAQPIDSTALRAQLSRAEAGACLVFEGWVRNHHLGQPVEKLEYEAFDALTRLEGDAIVTEAEQTHAGCRVLCVHRTGTLSIGELAVWIGVTSPHRHAAFLACRQVIEELKRRLPIWKKEHHPDGASEWVNCTTEAVARRLAPENYYERQTALPEVGSAGQAALAAAKILVVGVGGLGCPAALYLANAGVGRLTLADPGLVEVSNLHRQILFTADDVGAPKATVAASRLRAHNPLVHIEPLATAVTAANVRALVSGQSAVLDCSDNFATRFLVHDACRAAGVPLVSAAVHRFEGELNVFLPTTTGCLHCQWPDRAPAELDAGANCASGPVFAPAVGTLGIMQAAEALKLIWQLPVSSRHTRLLNLLDGTAQTIERSARAECQVCGPTAKSPRPTAEATDAVVLTPDTLAALGPVTMIALLETHDRFDARLAPPGTIAVAIHDLAQIKTLANSGPIVLTCRAGLRSAAVARLLRTEGIRAVYALAGANPAISAL